ncbi:hypothetical protein [Cardinium endosymbiont of Tipula unca]|uniref:hypothetical protein n=1 Tax=Cardinium endosymbiont of Tipula unca TaxID=3066216 RepID=UPI0030D0DEDD
MLGDLPKKSAKAYLELSNLLDDQDKTRLEKSIMAIRHSDELIAFIDSRLQIQKNYIDLVKLLPKREGIALKEKFESANFEQMTALVMQGLKELSVIHNATIQSRNNYIDLLKILPEEAALELKNSIAKCTNQAEIDTLIKSKLPNKLKNLDQATQQKLAKLPDSEREKIMVGAMKAEGATINPSIENKKPSSTKNNAPPTPNAHENNMKVEDKAEKTKVELAQQDKTPTINESADATEDYTTLFSSDQDINVLVNAKIQESNAHANEENTPQDSWGTKLPLKGNMRQQFLMLIMQFSQPDQKKLKELFDEAEPVSIQNFLSVYDQGFSMSERVELLSTMIYLYKGWPSLTIKLCNNPTSLGTGDKINLFRNTTRPQLSLLTKLDALLSE